MENNNGKTGKRKVTVALVYIGGSIGIAALLVGLGKITGPEFVSALDAAAYVSMAYIGLNVAKAGLEKWRRGNE